MGVARTVGRKGLTFWGGVNKNEQIYKDFIKLLCSAYRRGYSVVELTRILDQSCARKFYDLLRDEGEIVPLPRKRGRSYEMPELLKATLEKADLTYLKWCNSHDLDAETAGLALLSPLDRWDSASLSAHNALKNDWPRMYDRIYWPDSTPVYNFSPEKIPGLENKDTVIIVYDYEKYCFKAFVEKNPAICGFGERRGVALAGMTRSYILNHSIAKLSLLPPHPGPAFLPAWDEEEASRG